MDYLQLYEIRYQYAINNLVNLNGHTYFLVQQCHSQVFIL